MRLIKLREVMDKVGLSNSTIYLRIEDGSFPKPVKIGEHASAWVEDEVVAWIKDRIASRDAAVTCAQLQSRPRVLNSIPAVNGHTTYVYALQQEITGLIKIGFTATSVASRSSALATGSPYPLTLIFHQPGGLPEERAIHRRLKTHRTQGEWFRNTTEVLLLLRDIEKYGFGVVLSKTTAKKAQGHTALMGAFAPGSLLAGAMVPVSEVKK